MTSATSPEEFHTEGLSVYRGEEFVAECSDFIDGAAGQIARALNRLPQAEALLVGAAAALRSLDGGTVVSTLAQDLAEQIEDWMVNG